VGLAALALGLVIGPACSSNESPKVSASASSGSAATATAGRVLDVAGKVTVAGKQLAKGDSVGADDVIDTGVDGSVTIELAHNLARWELGPDKHVRVRESLAWKEPKRTEPVAQVEQEAASAGRPAERAAAGTVASSDTNDKPTKSGDDNKAAVKEKFDKLFGKDGKGGMNGVLGGDPNDPLGGGNWGTGGLGIKGTGPGGGGTGLGGGGTGEGTIGIGSIGKGGGTGTGTSTGTGTRGSKKGPPTLRPGTAQVVGALAPELIRRIVRTRFGQLRFCYEKGLKANPSLAGRLSVKFVIGADGAVPTAQDSGSTLSDAAVVSCMVGVFKQMQFPKPQGGGIVVITYPIVFDPGQ
jgi:hypothetical protein